MQALLVSRDPDAVAVLQTVMHSLDLESEVCTELEPAVERLAQGATSAVVVDYDVEHATGLLKVVRQHYAGSCVALAMEISILGSLPSRKLNPSARGST